MSKDRRTDGFSPIGGYALLGDGRTSALVAEDGSIDWLPVPLMDAPPVFCRLLGGRLAGCFELRPAVDYTTQRRYRPDTAVLETTFETEKGSVVVIDSLNRDEEHPLPWTELARVVRGETGEVPMHWRIAPGRRFGCAEPWVERCDLESDPGTAVIRVGDQTLVVVTTGAGQGNAHLHEVEGRFIARAGQEALVALVATDGEPTPLPPPGAIIERVQHTTEGWRRWRRRIHYSGPAPDAVARSALTLTLLTDSETGANLAAPTTSLPEVIGGDRNFDYRFVWVRDASFALDALSALSLSREVHSSLSWLLQAVARTAPDVHVFYKIDGQPASATEAEVEELTGYRDTSPVHVGNSAASQRQLGAYGHLLDAVWRYVEHGGHLDHGTSRMLAEMADRVCDLWRKPDAGLWELSSYQHYTSSKVGCWVALDRAVRLADQGQLPESRVRRWEQVGVEIHRWVDEHCWSVTKKAYTMYAGTDELDAAVLLMARTNFCGAADPRLSSTIEAVVSELTAEGPLLFRYSAMRDKEGAFAACTFWLVEALVHVGQTERAEEMFRSMLTYANDLDLLSEEIDPATGDLLGNFPQGLSHLALIGAGRALADAGIGS